MKTLKIIPQFLLASAVLFGTACSTSNTGTSTGAGTTSGSSAAGTSTSMDETSGNADTGATLGTNNPGTDMRSSSSYPGVAPMGATMSADMTAFMGTFATMKDPVFLMIAASSNLLEIQLGQAAAQRAANADVKRFAQMMVNHHTKATQQLKTVATPLGVTMPQTLMPVH
jgi:putative membrane protein